MTCKTLLWSTRKTMVVVMVRVMIKLYKGRSEGLMIATTAKAG